MICAYCKTGPLEVVIDLGLQAPANAYKQYPDQAENRYALKVALCPLCGLAQLTRDSQVPPTYLFANYAYRTGTATPLITHLAELAAKVGKGRVIEVGSNDGLFLEILKRRTGAQVLGVDPAENLALEANLLGRPTHCAYFGTGAVDAIAGVFGPGVDAIVARNVFAHVEQPHDFLEACGDLLSENGALYIEVPWVADMIRGNQIDQCYSEHRTYASARALSRVADEWGFRLMDVTKVPLHGGSILCEFRRGNFLGRPSPSVASALSEEQALGAFDPTVWKSMMVKAEAEKKAFLGLLYEYGMRGEKIMGYTAPAKGSVWLQFCGVGSGLLPGIYDTTKEKQGMYVPGTDIPILDPVEMEEDCPVALVVFAWNWIHYLADVMPGKRLIKPYGWTAPMGAR